MTENMENVREAVGQRAAQLRRRGVTVTEQDVEQATRAGGRRNVRRGR